MANTKNGKVLKVGDVVAVLVPARVVAMGPVDKEKENPNAISAISPDLPRYFNLEADKCLLFGDAVVAEKPTE